MIRRTFSILFVALVSLGLVACGGDDDSPEAAVHDYTAAFADEDADAAWEYWSAACQEEQSIQDFRIAFDLLTTGEPNLEVTEYHGDEVDGDVAIARFELSTEGDEVNEQEWILEDGDWKYNDCG